MTKVQPSPAYFGWKVYEGVRAAKATPNQSKHKKNGSGSLTHRRTATADTDVSAGLSSPSTSTNGIHGVPLPQRFDLHVRESLLTPLSLDASDMAAERSSMPAVVLVHGMVVSGTYMESFGACLAPYFRVYIPDLPGYGASVDQLPNPEQCLDAQQQVDVLVGWMQQAGLVSLDEDDDNDASRSRPPPPILIGNSFGNSLIADLAHRYPHCIRAAILQGPIQDATQVSAPLQLTQFVLNGRNEPLAQGLQVLRDYLTAGWRRVWASWLAVRACDVQAWVRESRIPMLLIPGELDCVSTLDWCRKLQETRDGISIVVVLDTPHTAVATVPKAVAEITRYYCENVLDAEERARKNGGNNSDGVDTSILQVLPPRLTLDFSLSREHVLSFVQEALALLAGPLLALCVLSLVTGAGVGWWRVGASYLVLVALASAWRVHHRLNLLSVLKAAPEGSMSLWSSDVMPPAVPGVADFDSATGFLRAHALALRGHDVPFLGRPSFAGDRLVSWLLNNLPERLRILAYALIGAAEASAPFLLKRNLDGDEVARAVVRHYPVDRRYSAIALGSSSGSLLHLYHLLDVPWLPNTLMFAVRRGPQSKQRPRFKGLSRSQDRQVYDMRSELEWGRPVGQEVLKRNPDWQLHHMADPNQDSLMVAWMAYFRLKQRRLLDAYKEFILRHLQPGGTLLLSHCKLRFGGVRVSDRHTFQIGGYGGLDTDEYVKPSKVVDAYIRREVLHQSEWEIQRAHEAVDRGQAELLHWNAPDPDTQDCEAEWGLPDVFRSDVEKFAKEHGFNVVVLESDTPQDCSPAITDLLRWWNAERRGKALLHGDAGGEDDDEPSKDNNKEGTAGVEVIKLSGSKGARLSSASVAAAVSSGSSATSSSRLSCPHQSLLINQFVLVDPWWAMRTGSVVYWTVFSTEDCFEMTLDYLTRADEDSREGRVQVPARDANDEAVCDGAVQCRPKFRQAHAALFPHGVSSVGFVPVRKWLQVLRDPTLFTHPSQVSGGSESAVPRGGDLLVGVREDLYPRDFQTMMHFHKQVHLITHQRYAMPWRRAHFLPLRKTLQLLRPTQ